MGFVQKVGCNAAFSKGTIYSVILLVDTLKLTATTAFNYFTTVLNPLAPQVAVQIKASQDNQ